MLNKKIRLAILGLGNCASALIQGINFYSDKYQARKSIGLLHKQIGPYSPQDIEVVAAFDVDDRKVGYDVSEAIFSPPNCTQIFCKKIKRTGVKVCMGKVLDSISDHMKKDNNSNHFKIKKAQQPNRKEVIKILKNSNADILVNYLPVGSEEATQFYAECALEANIAFINNIPVFIASNKDWAARFMDRGLPLIGDDIKSQIGATIVHRTLADLFKKRGATIDKMYQLNFGGNTDFNNMLNRDRLKSKKISKTESVKAILKSPILEENIHISPSDYVPWLKDNKIAFIRIEGKIFGHVPINLELRLSVEDSPNSAGVAIDMIRCCKLALDKKIAGVLIEPSAYFCKRPPKQFSDEDAYNNLNKFIARYS